MTQHIKELKNPLIVTFLFIVAVTAIYFSTEAYKSNMQANTLSSEELLLFKDIQLKAAYGPEGELKVFALANSEGLNAYKASSGTNIPQGNAIVIGYEEAQMMIDEKLFQNPGDEIEDLFGIDVIINGVLEKSGTLADDFHFLSVESYETINAEPNVLFIKFKDEQSPKLFYLYDMYNSPLTLEFEQGGLENFNIQNIDGKTYYPILIGSKEAGMMIEEKLFTKTGDTLDSFFGKDVVIAGILKETNTSADMAHIVSPDFFG